MVEKKVWSSSDNGEIEYISLTSDRLEEALKVLEVGFYPYENVCKAIGIANKPEAAKELELMLIEIAKHGVSIAAIDTKTEKMVGVTFNKIQHKNTSSKDILENYIKKAKHPEAESLYEFLADMEDSMDPFSPYQADCLMELLFLGVLPEYSRKGIGYMLANVSVKLGTLLYQGKNIKTPLDDSTLPLEPRPQVVTALFTSFKTQRIGRKLNFDVQKMISYDDLFFNGRSYRSIVGYETEGVTCECKSLK